MLINSAYNSAIPNLYFSAYVETEILYFKYLGEEIVKKHMYEKSGEMPRCSKYINRNSEID